MASWLRPFCVVPSASIRRAISISALLSIAIASSLFLLCRRSLLLRVFLFLLLVLLALLRCNQTSNANATYHRVRTISIATTAAAAAAATCRNTTPPQPTPMPFPFPSSNVVLSLLFFIIFPFSAALLTSDKQDKGARWQRSAATHRNFNCPLQYQLPPHLWLSYRLAHACCRFLLYFFCFFVFLCFCNPTHFC